jgi:hypothetical protein
LSHTSDALSSVFLLVTFHPYFVASDNGFQPVILTESLCDIRSKLHANASLARSTAGFGLWIGPEHLHHQARLAWLALIVAIELSYVVKSNLIV